MVFEILGVTLLEIIKRYNYKGVPLPLVRIIARQVLIGLDYLHRICHIIHTDLKPENVLVSLTKEEIKEIVAQGQFGKSKSKYKFGAAPLLNMQASEYELNGSNKEEETKRVDLSKPLSELTEEERKELKKQKKREKKKRRKKKKQAAKAEMNKENDTQEGDDNLNESRIEEAKTKADDQPKVITNTMRNKPMTTRRSSDPTIPSSLATSNWTDDLVKLEPEITPDKKQSEELKPLVDR
eukprot:TRINITY_DN2941_c0_g1_i8.p1 TRINITY_DN2941_c0_g1~~TRINITY_DN2941_c0_g1_i8.p1  ORF type:complete len:239 (-),score=59.68 TRINITY_DN2941_c0_g1_i8:103-819(-)